MATEGEEVNAMAPSHFAYRDKESQIPSWTGSSIPTTQVWPTLTLSQTGRYGFKLPSQPTTSSGDIDLEHGMGTDTREYAARCP